MTNVVSVLIVSLVGALQKEERDSCRGQTGSRSYLEGCYKRKRGMATQGGQEVSISGKVTGIGKKDKVFPGQNKGSHGKSSCLFGTCF